jgi:hypothetical protein
MYPVDADAKGLRIVEENTLVPLDPELVNFPLVCPMSPPVPPTLEVLLKRTV